MNLPSWWITRITRITTEEYEMSRMHNPPHPGLTLRDDVLPALGMNVTDTAQALGVTRPTLSRVLNGAAAVSPEMALRLERWLGVEHGGRADVWLGMQAAYDLWAAEQKAKTVIGKIKPLSAAALAVA
jgi:addiction module HigA family antidote